jgi:hypothetical protein
LHGLAQPLGARDDIARRDIRAALVVEKRLDRIARDIEAIGDGREGTAEVMDAELHARPAGHLLQGRL